MKQPTTAPILLLSILFLLFSIIGGILLYVSDLATHPFRLVIAIMFLIASAAIVARPVVYFLTRGAGSLFFPNNTSQNKPPLYSMAQAKRIQGNYNDAFQLYNEIVKVHPQELSAWRAMVEISLDNLKDVKLAQKVLEKGLHAIPTVNGRDLLQRTFDEGLE